jgi:hypothetical protein
MFAHRVSRHLFVWVSSILIAGSSAAAAPVFYGVTGTNLLQFDMGAQTATVVAALQSGGGPLGLIEDADFDASGNLWAVRQGNTGGFPPTPVSQSYLIDIGTGNSLLQGDFGTSANMQSLAFRTSNSTFYSVNEFGGTTASQLVTANLAAGAVTSVAGVAHGLPGPIRVDALAFAPDGTLYGVWNGGSCTPFGCSLDYKLVSFNLNSGLGSVIGSIGTSAQTFLSLRFDSAGTAYTVDSNSGNVFTVNLGTGQGTFLFAGGPAAAGTRGLAFVPEPGTAALIGLAAMMGIRRRQGTGRRK